MASKRERWDEHYMRCAEEFLSELKCQAGKSCCVLIKDEGIISIGLSGTLPGLLNCGDLFRKINGVWHRRNPEERAELERRLTQKLTGELRRESPTDYLDLHWRGLGGVAEQAGLIGAVAHLPFDQSFPQSELTQTWESCEDQREHYFWSKKNEVHAEVNALAKAAKLGISTEGSTAYIIHAPCNSCSLILVQFGVSRVVFRKQYEDEPEALEKLRLKGIDVTCLEERG
jgi:dCMP deaminase